VPASAPRFIPFLGAVVGMRRMPENAWREAEVALAGALLGSLGAAAVFGAGLAVDSRFLKALAYVGFLIDLFNLPPRRPTRRRQGCRRPPPGALARGAGGPRLPRGLSALADPPARRPVRDPRAPAPLADPAPAGVQVVLPGASVATRSVAAVSVGLATLLVVGMSAAQVPRRS
jgi:hypothetical protein